MAAVVVRMGRGLDAIVGERGEKVGEGAW